MTGQSPEEGDTSSGPPPADPRLEIPEILRKPVHDPRRKPRQTQAGFAGAAKAWAIAFDFIGTILAGAALGWLVDRWQGTSPWLLLTGLTIGFVGAFYRIVRATNR